MPKALLYDAFGGIDVLYLGDVPRAELQPGQVRIAVRAAALNPFDFKMRSGVVPMPATFPHGVGNDFAGLVIEVGDGSTYYTGEYIVQGDEVLGFADQNAIAEEIVVGDHQLAPKPENLTWSVAGGLAVSGLTADACITALDINASDVVGVSAAAGSVGQVFCQLALAREATVVGSASTANQSFLRSLGVTPVDYSGDLVAQFETAAPSGLTKFQDNFGRPAIDVALGLGIPAQNVCSIVDHAAVAELGLATPGRYERSASKLFELAELIATEQLSLSIEAEFSLGRYRQAFELLESRHVRGKVVITF